MIVNILRSVGAGLLGLLAAFVFVVALEGVWAILYPFAPGADTSDMATVCEHIRNLPADAFLIGSAGWTADHVRRRLDRHAPGHRPARRAWLRRRRPPAGRRPLQHVHAPLSRPVLGRRT